MVPAGLHILLVREKGETDYAQSVGACTILCGSRAFYRSDLSKNILYADSSSPVSPGGV